MYCVPTCRSSQEHVCARADLLPFSVSRVVVWAAQELQNLGNQSQNSMEEELPLLARKGVERRKRRRSYLGYLVKQLPVDEQRVVGLGQLAGQEGEETAHLGGGEVRVVHHHLGDGEHTCEYPAGQSGCSPGRDSQSES